MKGDGKHYLRNQQSNHPKNQTPQQQQRPQSQEEEPPELTRRAENPWVPLALSEEEKKLRKIQS